MIFGYFGWFAGDLGVVLCNLFACCDNDLCTWLPCWFVGYSFDVVILA